jgi:rhodanese-related sulfurtransferase
MIQPEKLFTAFRSVDADQARGFMAKRREREYALLDVRQPEVYEREHIPGSKLTPCSFDVCYHTDRFAPFSCKFFDLTDIVSFIEETRPFRS